MGSWEGAGVASSSGKGEGEPPRVTWGLAALRSRSSSGCGETFPGGAGSGGAQPLWFLEGLYLYLRSDPPFLWLQET